MTTMTQHNTQNSNKAGEKRKTGQASAPCIERTQTGSLSSAQNDDNDTKQRQGGGEEKTGQDIASPPCIERTQTGSLSSTQSDDNDDTN